MDSGDYYLGYSREELYGLLNEINNAIDYFRSSNNLLNKLQLLDLESELNRVNAAIRHVSAASNLLPQQVSQIESLVEDEGESLVEAPLQ